MNKKMFAVLFCTALLAIYIFGGAVLAEEVAVENWCSMQDLGTLGGDQSVARGINNLGQVVGFSTTASGEEHAFLWTEEDGMQDLGTFPGGDWSRALDINDSGQVVGWSTRSGDGYQHPFLWTQGGVMQDLGTPPTDWEDTEARGINNHGQVVGYSLDEDGWSHAFLWTAGVWQDLGTLGNGADSWANGINDNGEVVGSSIFDINEPEEHAFLWTSGGGMQDLGTLGDDWSWAFGINNQGQVVGTSDFIRDTAHAFLWTQGGGMQDLGTLPGWTEVFGSGINNLGQVVGEFDTPVTVHAFLWTAEGGMQDLGTLPGGDWSGARGINDLGQIVGVSGTASGEDHAVLWTCSDLVTVEIDIKPGSDPNTVNCSNEKGIVPVAILTTDDFDAGAVDHTTVSFQGASETHVDKKTGEPRRHQEDVDDDGDIDLVFHFRLGDTSLTCDSAEGKLTGQTYEGLMLEGTDSVHMVIAPPYP